MPETPCILSVNKPNPTHGYALRVIDGVRDYEHRHAWMAAHGAIPEGMTIDHVCHDPATCPAPGPNCPHRRCINLEHLALVTNAANAGRAYSVTAAKTHCPQEHPYNAENTYVDPRGRRHCRICTREHIRRHKQRKREARNA